MSDEGRRTARVYFTRSRARRENEGSGSEDIDLFNYDGGVESSAGNQAGPSRIPPETGEHWANQLAAQPQQSQHTPHQWVRGVAQLLGVAAAKPFTSKKQLQFDPLQGRRKPKAKVVAQVLGMAQRQAIADLKVKFEKFKGPKKKDPDGYVAEFEAAWQASGLAGVYADADKMYQFEATFVGPAIQWFSHFPAGHFNTFNALKTAFLSRFRKEKTPNDVLKKIKNIKQKKMLVEDYAQKFTQLVNRLEVAERPTPEMLAGYFLKG